MEFKDREDLQNYIYENLGIFSDVAKVTTIIDGIPGKDKLEVTDDSTIERIVDKKLEALENGDMHKAKAAQEIYSQYCGVSENSGAFSFKQQQRLRDSTNIALQRLTNELKDTSWRSPEEKKQLLGECEDFLATVDGVAETEDIDLTDFKNSTDRLRDEIPQEKESQDIESKDKSDEPEEIELDEVDEKEMLTEDDAYLGMENIPAHEREEAEDIKQEAIQEEQDQTLESDTPEPVNSRMVKIDTYESMYDKAKHKLKELFNKIRAALMPRAQENEKDMSDDGR